MGKGLVIRATSIQHLPLVLRRIKGEFPKTHLDILTHPHAAPSLCGLFKKENIVSYHLRGCFSLRGLLKGGVWRRLQGEKYDFIVVPVENIYGAGYENVIRVALALLPRRVVLVNKAGDIRLKSRLSCSRMLARHALLLPLSLVLSLGLAIYLLGRLASLKLKRALLS